MTSGSRRALLTLLLLLAVLVPAKVGLAPTSEASALPRIGLPGYTATVETSAPRPSSASSCSTAMDGNAFVP